MFRLIPQSLMLVCCLFCSHVRAEEALSGSARPNILFCIADDASYPHMGAYGCRWVTTPGFDRVAKEGLLFTRAYTPNAKCAPSRACILTGRNSWQLEEAANHWCYFPAKFKTYCETLSEQGYFVGKTGKGWAPGIAKDAAGKNRALTGLSFDQQRIKPPTKAISGNHYTANFADFLQAKPADQPFCFWYGSTEPHRAYEYGSGIRKGGKNLEMIDEVPAFWPDNETVRTDLLDYAYEIEYFDQHLAQMLDLLAERGELKNTLVVVTADNGMPFPRVKGQEYEYSNHLPLAMMWPAGIKNPGRTVSDLVSFIDFAPTFLEIAGVSPQQTGMQSLTGHSLMDIFADLPISKREQKRDFLLIGKERHDIGRPHDQGYPIRGIVTQDFFYLKNYETTRWPGGNPETGYLNCDGSPTKTEILHTRKMPELVQFWEQSFGKRPAEEFFQLTEDAECLNNQAENPEYQAELAKLRERMEAELTKQNDPRMLGRGYLFDEYPYANAAEKGFYERFHQGEKINAGWVNESDFETDLME